ncbi:MAG: sulfotransferase family 2 domain-containing protein [Candidatus Roizmanbacteria bacterium]|nr:sulfotransferase family 2 domain-containing protein [Candidatus Roizmanbacteria bacterium]
MQSAEKHVSVHIEKTAGTSLTRLYMDLYGARNVLIYNPVSDTVARSDRVANIRTKPIFEKIKQLAITRPFLPLISTLLIRLRDKTVLRHPADNLPDDFTAVHGHFLSRRFDDQITDSLHTVVLRHPLDRMISHYAHWKRAKGVPLFRRNIPFADRVTFEEFAFREEFQNYETQALDGKGLESFDVVGTTEHIDMFGAHILSALQERGFLHQTPGEHEYTIPHLYKNPQPTTLEALGIDKPGMFEEEFQRYHFLDYENYDVACSLEEMENVSIRS